MHSREKLAKNMMRAHHVFSTFKTLKPVLGSKAQMFFASFFSGVDPGMRMADRRQGLQC